MEALIIKTYCFNEDLSFKLYPNSLLLKGTIASISITIYIKFNVDLFFYALVAYLDDHGDYFDDSHFSCKVALEFASILQRLVVYNDTLLLLIHQYMQRN